MNKKIRQVKDKEGVVFLIQLDTTISKKDKKRPSVNFVKNFIEEKLKSNNVYPLNNRIGFNGEIEPLSYFIAGLIETYMNTYFIENQLDII